MKVLDRKLLRDMQRAKGQAIAVTMVILCGVASFFTMLSAHRGLTLTRDVYYRDYRLADFWVPMERAPIRALHKVAAVPGVARVEGRIVKDVNLDVPGQSDPAIGRVISLPGRRGHALNDVHIVSGRYFSSGAMNEVIVGDQFARAHGLSPGDRIWATMNDRKQPLRIVGTGLSPEYVYMIRDAREMLPNLERFTVLWVKRDFAEMALGMQEAVNEIVGFFEPGANRDLVLDRIENLLEPYGALSSIRRKDQLSNHYLSGEISGLGVSARIIPAIFLGIAALVLLLMLGRIVQRDRTQIGVLKAYGYSNTAIGAHYVKFALAVSVTGALLGTGCGHWMAGAMMRMYVSFFQFPLLRHRFYPDILVMSLLISVAAGGAGAVWAVVRVVRINPAEAMRPAAPRAGHRLLLERIGVVWSNVGFIGKIILRNIFRCKVRAALTVLGVSCSLAIIMVGYFTGDSMDYLVEYQFARMQRQDARVAFHAERGRNALYDARRFPWVRVAEPQLDYPFTLKSSWRKKDVLVTGVMPEGRLLHLETVDGGRINVGEGGLVVSETIAEDLHLRPGDVVVMKPLLGRIKRESRVRVRAVVQQYLGTGAYMNIGALSHILNEPFALNAVLLTVGDGRESDLNRYLKDVPGVAAVETKAETQKHFEDTMAKSNAISNMFLSIFAGVIACAIIYNSTVISLSERRRELASLRVLGFRLAEVRRILFGENTLLAAVGVLLGLPLGTWLCRLLVRAYDTDIYRLPFYMSRRTYVTAVVSIAVFVMLANLAVWRRVGRLDMVEVLKARE